MEEGESLVHSLPFSDKSYQYPHHPPDPYQSPTPAPYYASTPAPYHAPTPTPYHSPSPSPYAPYAPHAPTAGPYSPMHYPLMSGARSSKLFNHNERIGHAFNDKSTICWKNIYLLPLYYLMKGIKLTFKKLSSTIVSLN